MNILKVIFENGAFVTTRDGNTYIASFPFLYPCNCSGYPICNESLKADGTSKNDSNFDVMSVKRFHSSIGDWIQVYSRDNGAYQFNKNAAPVKVEVDLDLKVNEGIVTFNNEDFVITNQDDYDYINDTIHSGIVKVYDLYEEKWHTVWCHN